MMMNFIKIKIIIIEIQVDKVSQWKMKLETFTFFALMLLKKGVKLFHHKLWSIAIYFEEYISSSM